MKILHRNRGKIRETTFSKNTRGFYCAKRHRDVPPPFFRELSYHMLGSMIVFSLTLDHAGPQTRPYTLAMASGGSDGHFLSMVAVAVAAFGVRKQKRRTLAAWSLILEMLDDETDSWVEGLPSTWSLKILMCLE